MSTPKTIESLAAEILELRAAVAALQEAFAEMNEPRDGVIHHVRIDASRVISAMNAATRKPNG